MLDQHPEFSDSLGEILDSKFEELRSLIGSLRGAIVTLKADSMSEDQQCNVCLLSRSAYTEFVSVSEFSGQIPKPEADELKLLLKQALDCLPSGEFHRSISKRQRDFLDYCADASSRAEFDTAVTI